MPGIGGLSIANNLLANSASLNLNRNQAALQTSVTRLSSGLRINTAADDPSGLAIAENLQAQVEGFDQGSRNIQDATNASQVAEGALSTVTSILTRIRALSVQGASDITSSANRASLQSEVQQLLLEVNRIAQNTNFNGQNLLDGSHAGFQQQVNVNALITTNSNLAGGGTLVSPTLVSFVPSNASVVDGTIQVQVAQLTSTTQGLIVSFYDSKANAVTTTVLALNASGVAAPVVIDNVTVGFGAVGTLDVGTSSFIKVSQYVAAASNPNAPAFNFQSGAAEGATIQVGFVNMSTSSLRIANVNLVGPINSSGVFASGSLASEDAIGQIDNALATVLGQRAQLGATINRLQYTLNSNNVTSVNLNASESAIRDLNIGAATTQYTKLQILVQVGTSVLAQANQNAQSVVSLFR
ncbi:MAG: flagellin [Candidatus Elarobacter sp.]